MKLGEKLVELSRPREERQRMFTTSRYMAIAIAVSLLLPHPAVAHQHLVAEEEMASRLQAAAAERASDQLEMELLLSRGLAAQPALTQGVDIQRLRTEVAALTDDEMRELASRAKALESDPAAGGIVKTLVIVGVVVLVVVLLAAAIVESCKQQGAQCVN